jgi:hypothetical protein
MHRESAVLELVRRLSGLDPSAFNRIVALGNLLWSNDRFFSPAYCAGMAERKLQQIPVELKPRRIPPVVNQQKFFLRLGKRVCELRKAHGHSQEDMIAYGFSARHWQQIEAGRPITVTTLLRMCAVFGISVESLVRGLDKGIY